MFKEITDDLKTYLSLEKEPVGVKIYYDKKTYKNIEVKEVVKPAQYCMMVKSASLGNSIKIPANLFKCSASARVLGMEGSSKSYISGKEYYGYGFYESIEKSKEYIKKFDIIGESAVGLVLMPLSEYEVEPDVIILISNSYNIMRIIQAYSYYYGIKDSFKLSGNQAICAECTSTPYLNKDINISLMCAGTRYACRWDENSIAIGIHKSKLDNVVKGLKNTVNKIETNPKKERIKLSLEKRGKDSEDIEYGTAYFM